MATPLMKLDDRLSGIVYVAFRSGTLRLCSDLAGLGGSPVTKDTRTSYRGTILVPYDAYDGHVLFHSYSTHVFLTAGRDGSTVDFHLLPFRHRTTSESSPMGKGAVRKRPSASVRRVWLAPMLLPA